MDVTPSEIHLPISVHVAPLSFVTEEFQNETGTVTHPRIQNLKHIRDHGYSFEDFIDDETLAITEGKSPVEIPVLTAVGRQLRDVKMLRAPDTVSIPINAWNYVLEAMMHGLTAESIVDNADVRLEDPGYTFDTPNYVPGGTFDGVATMIRRMETIETIKFCMLARILPDDPIHGAKYILAPKLAISKEQILKNINKEYFKETVSFQSLKMTQAELARWQNILPDIKASIGIYKFHANLES